jgi:tetratricopeptide (TPR) repeat protein
MAGKSREAADTYAEALPILSQFSDEDPQNAQLQRHLAEAHYGIATAYLRLADATAGEHYQKALQIRRQLAEEDPTNAAEQAGWMLALGRCGEHQQAARIADQVRQTAEEDSHLLYNAATGYAVCAQAVATSEASAEHDEREAAKLHETYGQLAVETLQAAIDHGYQVTAELELDPDLDGIRDRADFQALLGAHRPDPETGNAEPT